MSSFNPTSVIQPGTSIRKSLSGQSRCGESLMSDLAGHAARYPGGIEGSAGIRVSEGQLPPPKSSGLNGVSGHQEAPKNLHFQQNQPTFQGQPHQQEFQQQQNQQAFQQQQNQQAFHQQQQKLYQQPSGPSVHQSRSTCQNQHCCCSNNNPAHSQNMARPNRADVPYQPSYQYGFDPSTFQPQSAQPLQNGFGILPTIVRWQHATPTPSITAYGTSTQIPMMLQLDTLNMPYYPSTAVPSTPGCPPGNQPPHCCNPVQCWGCGINNGVNNLRGNSNSSSGYGSGGSIFSRDSPDRSSPVHCPGSNPARKTQPQRNSQDIRGGEVPFQGSPPEMTGISGSFSENRPGHVQPPPLVNLTDDVRRERRSQDPVLTQNVLDGQMQVDTSKNLEVRDPSDGSNDQSITSPSTNQDHEGLLSQFAMMTDRVLRVERPASSGSLAVSSDTGHAPLIDADVREYEQRSRNNSPFPEMDGAEVERTLRELWAKARSEVKADDVAVVTVARSRKGNNAKGKKSAASNKNTRTSMKQSKTVGEPLPPLISASLGNSEDEEMPLLLPKINLERVDMLKAAGPPSKPKRASGPRRKR